MLLNLFKPFRIVAYGFLYYFGDPVAGFWARKALVKSLPKKSVLVVRVDAIGDFIVWLHSAKELRQAYPSDRYTITLLANQSWADLAKPCPYWDEIVIVDREQFTWNPVYRWSMLRGLAKRSFDITINPIFFRYMLVDDSIVRVVASPLRIGWYLYQDSNPYVFFFIKKLFTRWYTRLISCEQGASSEFQKNVHFMKELGVTHFHNNIPLLLSKGAEVSIKIPAPYFVLVPDAGWDGRQWPMSHFADIARRIHNVTGWQPVLMGTNRLIASDEEALGMINLLGKTSITDYVGIIRGAKMLIGNESSSIHIAALFQVESFCITGGGHWGRFVPYSDEQAASYRAPVIIHHQMDCYGCQWFCKYPRRSGPVKCIQDIGIDKVWGVICSSLS